MRGSPLDQSDRPPDRPDPRWLPRDGYPGRDYEGRIATVAREMKYEGSPRSQDHRVNAASLLREGLHVGAWPHREVRQADSALRDWQQRHHARQSNEVATRQRAAHRSRAAQYDLHGFLKPGGSGRRHVAEPGARPHPVEGPEAASLRQLHFENYTDVATFEPNMRASASSAAWLMAHDRPSARMRDPSLTSYHSRRPLSTPRGSTGHSHSSPRGARPSSPRGGWRGETAWLRSHHGAGGSGSSTASSHGRSVRRITAVSL